MPARSCALLVHLLRLDDGGTMAGDSQVREWMVGEFMVQGQILQSCLMVFLYVFPPMVFQWFGIVLP